MRLRHQVTMAEVYHAIICVGLHLLLFCRRIRFQKVEEKISAANI